MYFTNVKLQRRYGRRKSESESLVSAELTESSCEFMLHAAIVQSRI